MAAEPPLLRTRKARLEDAYNIHRPVDDFSHDGTLLHRAYSEICKNIRTFRIVESDNDEFLGCASLHVYGPHLAEIRSIVVRSTIRGKGAGGLLVSAAEAVQEDIAAGCDLVVLSKFGRLEAAGNGLRRAFEAAMESSIPLLTSVSSSVAENWTRFAASGFISLPADAAEVDAWIRAVLPRGSRAETPRCAERSRH